MADLKIVQSQVSALKHGFEGIQSTLDALSRSSFEPTHDNVGHDGFSRQLQAFNARVSDTQGKYTKKTQNFIDFLTNVSTGSDDADRAIASSLSVGEAGGRGW